MWTRLFGVSARRRRKLRSRWGRADEIEVRRRHEELALDRESVAILTSWANGCCDADMTRRILTVVNYADGWPPGFIAEAFRCSASAVFRALQRYREEGPAGLVDRRESNGRRKVDEDYLKTLATLVAGQPTDFGQVRPTWTQELLVKVARKKTGVEVSVPTMSRALSVIGARWGRPRPSVACPWPRRSRVRAVNRITRMIERSSPDEVFLWEDEVDVHLNPKLGPDWMLRGQQKDVPTPGKNVKRYIAGAIHAGTKKMVWVTGQQKASALFISLLWRLAGIYRRFRVIHVIVDNYIIHKSKITQKAVAAFGGKVLLHFLPPYCPNDNPVERVWEDFHAAVTRNHRCRTIDALMQQAERYLDRRNDRLDRPQTVRAAA